MQISQLYVYPIKSLRPTILTEAIVTRHGFPYDRCFMLLKVQADKTIGSRKLKNMHVPEFPAMSLFLTELVLPSDSENRDGKIIVTWRQPPTSESTQSRTLEVPLQPDVDGLEEIDITMHQSPIRGYGMGSRYNDWFTRCFGFPVILAYVGANRRQVLGSVAPNLQNVGGGGWLSSITSKISYVGKKEDDRILTFADCAAYLVVSDTSVQNVSARLADGVEMDVTKFRPNIVVSGAETAFEEDYWGELTIGDDDSGTARIMLTSNCVRCRSVNVDYETGKHGTGESGQVFKKLTKDRRVDPGAKYSPVFGRYGFLKDRDGVRICIGDPVEVSKRLSERTIFGTFTLLPSTTKIKKAL